MARDLFADQDLNWGDRARLGLQGASFNLSDEALAKFESTFGSGTYEENVAEQRRKIESARSKPGSFKYELGGAMIPALLAAPLTGGASVPLTAARLAALGGTQALTAGLGAREGSLGERFTESPLTLAAETGAGALLGAVSTKAVPFIKSAASAAATPFKGMVRALTGQPPRVVETEVRRMAASVYPELGRSEGVRRIVKEIEEGAIFPDLSGQAAIDTRALVSSAGRGGAAIEETIKARAERFSREARESLQADLVPPNTQGNLVRAMNETTEGLKAAESAAYKRIFTDLDLPPSAELNRAVLDLTKMGKSNLNELEELIAARRLSPLFKKNDKGVYELTRNVSLEDGEILRRALQDSVDSAFGTKQRGNLGQALKEVELDLRSILDDLSPDLKTTRANWAQISKVKKTFDESRKIFGKTAEDAEIYIEDIIADGNTEVIEAMRAGAASGLKAKTSATSPNAVLRNLNNADRKERIILEKLYPGDSAEEIFKKINRAAQATETKNIVLHGSQTAPTAGAQARIGTGVAEVIREGVNVAAGNWVTPIMRLASKVLSREGKELTQEQLEQVARIIITEDPNIMQKALSDPIIQEVLIRKIQQTGNLLQRSVAGASGYGAGEGTRRLFDDPNQ